VQALGLMQNGEEINRKSPVDPTVPRIGSPCPMGWWICAGSGWAPFGRDVDGKGWVHSRHRCWERSSLLQAWISSGQHHHHQAEPFGRWQDLPKQAMGTEWQSHAGIRIWTSTMVFPCS